MDDSFNQKLSSEQAVNPITHLNKIITFLINLIYIFIEEILTFKNHKNP